MVNKYLYFITTFLLSIFISTSSFSGHHEKAVGYFYGHVLTNCPDGTAGGYFTWNKEP